MAGKGAPPLFDLIRTGEKATPPPGARAAPGRQDSNGHAEPKAAPAPEPKPEPRRQPEPQRVAAAAVSEPAVEAAPPLPPPAPAPEATSEKSSDEADGPRIDFGREFSVPVSVLYVGAPLLLVGALVAYSWGFKAGGRDRDDQLKPYLQPEEVVDPLVSGGGGSVPAATTERPAVRPVAPAPPESRQATAPVQRPAGSPVTRDSRVADHNYLLIARMDGERAIKAAMALTGKGVPTIAVETQGSRSNNGWCLYSLLGIPSEKFRQEWQLRADHKAKVEAACRDLGADAGGPIDASTAYWEKYAP